MAKGSLCHCVQFWLQGGKENGLPAIGLHGPSAKLFNERINATLVKIGATPILVGCLFSITVLGSSHRFLVSLRTLPSLLLAVV